MRFEIDWASLMVGGTFTSFFVFEGNFPSTSTRGLYLEGRFNGGSFALPVWRAYIWRGLYMEGLIFGILRYLGTGLSLRGGGRAFSPNVAPGYFHRKIEEK